MKQRYGKNLEFFFLEVFDYFWLLNIWINDDNSRNLSSQQERLSILHKNQGSRPEQSLPLSCWKYLTYFVGKYLLAQLLELVALLFVSKTLAE